jgi:hypothetical protein
MTRTLIRTAVALVLAAGALAGCSGTDEPATADRDPGSADPRPGPEGLGGTPEAVPYQLYTHCGIDEARLGSTYYEAVTPLSDGAGNPPEGWDNPVQEGWMTVVSDGRAVFTDDAGHEVAFRVRPGATSFKALCQ